MKDNCYTTVNDMNQRGSNLPNSEKAGVEITNFEVLKLGEVPMTVFFLPRLVLEGV